MKERLTELSVRRMKEDRERVSVDNGVIILRSLSVAFSETQANRRPIIFVFQNCSLSGVELPRTEIKQNTGPEGSPASLD